MAITVRQYRFDEQGECKLEKEETVKSNRAAESRVRRWCREAGQNPDELAEADTEFGFQWSLEWEDCGEPGSLLWESESSALMGG